MTHFKDCRNTSNLISLTLFGLVCYLSQIGILISASNSFGVALNENISTVECVECSNQITDRIETFNVYIDNSVLFGDCKSLRGNNTSCEDLSDTITCVLDTLIKNLLNSTSSNDWEAFLKTTTVYTSFKEQITQIFPGSFLQVLFVCLPPEKLHKLDTITVLLDASHQNATNAYNHHSCIENQQQLSEKCSDLMNKWDGNYTLMNMIDSVYKLHGGLQKVRQLVELISTQSCELQLFSLKHLFSLVTEETNSTLKDLTIVFLDNFYRQHCSEEFSLSEKPWEILATKQVEAWGKQIRSNNYSDITDTLKTFPTHIYQDEKFCDRIIPEAYGNSEKNMNLVGEFARALPGTLYENCFLKVIQQIEDNGHYESPEAMRLVFNFPEFSRKYPDALKQLIIHRSCCYIRDRTHKEYLYASEVWTHDSERGRVIGWTPGTKESEGRWEFAYISNDNLFQIRNVRTQSLMFASSYKGTFYTRYFDQPYHQVFHWTSKQMIEGYNRTLWSIQMVGKEQSYFILKNEHYKEYLTAEPMLHESSGTRRRILTAGSNAAYFNPEAFHMEITCPSSIISCAGGGLFNF